MTLLIHNSTEKATSNPLAMDAPNIAPSTTFITPYYEKMKLAISTHLHRPTTESPAMAARQLGNILRSIWLRMAALGSSTPASQTHRTRADPYSPPDKLVHPHRVPTPSEDLTRTLHTLSLHLTTAAMSIDEWQCTALAEQKILLADLDSAAASVRAAEAGVEAWERDTAALRQEVRDAQTETRQTRAEADEMRDLAAGLEELVEEQRGVIERLRRRRRVGGSEEERAWEKARADANLFGERRDLLARYAKGDYEDEDEDEDGWLHGIEQ